MPKQEGDRELVEGLVKGLAVISSFDESSPEMTLTEVSKKTGYSPAATRRSLFTLARLGYVRQVGRNFLLTPKILQLGSAYLRAAGVEEALVPVLREVVEQFPDESSVAVLNGDRILYVAHTLHRSVLRPFAGTGVTHPAYLTSMGRVLLGTLDEQSFARYLEDLVTVAFTDATVTDKDELAAAVEQARRDGYSVAVDQIVYGVTAIAVPIKLASGEVVASLNSSGYTGRLTTEELVERRLPCLRAAAAQVSDILERYPALRDSLQSDRNLP